MASQQVAASGLRGGNLNRILITAPVGGRVIGRNAVLGQVFMISRLVTFSVERRWLVLLFTAIAALAGVFALRLPIDAVPDTFHFDYNRIGLDTSQGE